MFRTLKLAIISALMLGTASAAMAQPYSHQNTGSYTCQTDEGQGRTSPCDAGNGGA